MQAARLRARRAAARSARPASLRCQRQVGHPDVEQLFVSEVGPVVTERGRATGIMVMIGIVRIYELADGVASGRGIRRVDRSPRRARCHELMSAVWSRCRAMSSAAGARPRQGRRRVQVEPGGHLSRTRRRGGRRRRRSPPSCRRCASSRARSAPSAATLADALETHVAARQGAVAALRLRQHAVRRGHARLRRRRACSRRCSRSTRSFGAAGVVHRAGDAQGRAAPTVERFIAAEPRLRQLRLLPARHRPPRAAHADATPKRRSSPTPRRWPARASNIYTILVERRLPVPDDHAERRPHGEGRSGRLRRAAHVGQPRRSQGGDVGVLRRARRLRPDLRHDDELERAEGAVLLASRASTRRTSRRRSNGPNIPVSVYTRLVDGVNRHLPTFHRYLKLRKRMMGVTDDLHYYDLYAPLVASVEPALHAGGSAAARRRGDGAARRGLHRRAAARVQRALARLVSDGRQALGRLLERRRLRRASVHAAQLPRAVQRREHAGARARPHDAQLLLEQDAAVRRRPATRRSSPRSRRRSTRRCSSTTC